jgi:uncharacterized protein involved in exopolysaccharide biosynthesis
LTMNASDTTKHDAGDEISLRDLYLILKRNVWWVAGAALLVGVITFVILGLQPPRFQAEGTTIITPAQLNLQGRQGLTFNPTPIVSFETYSTLARSRPVLETVLNKLPEPLTIAELERIGNLRRLLAPGGGQAAQAAPLVVIHQVTHEDPELAARVANTWAEVSLETIRNSVLGTLEPVREITQRELSRLRVVLEEAEEALSTFERGTNVELLLKRFERLNVRVADFELRAGDLESALAVTQARVTVLETQLGAELAKLASIDPTAGAFLAGLSLTEALAVVADQVAFLDRAYAQAQAVLDQFDKVNDLALLDAQIGQLSARIPQLETRLSSLPNEIERLQITLTSLQAQLKAQPPLLTLRDHITANPLLSELALQGGNVQEVLLETGLLRETLNPRHFSVLEALLSTEVQLSELYEEERLVQRELAELTASLEAKRAQRVRLNSQRELLVIERDRSLADLRALREQQGRLQLIALGAGNGERSLREATPEVLELRRLLREQEVILAAQQRELTELTRTLERDHEALSVLQQELASSEVRLEQLTRARDEALEAYQEVVRVDPTISYFTALSPVSARVLSEATVPVEPVGRGRLLATVLAVLVTGAVLLIFVFLREAITDPAVADSKWRKARSSLT